MTNRNALASVSHRDHSGLDGIMAMEFFATQFISLHILPNLSRCHREWVNVAIVSLSIVEDNVASRHRFTINLLVAHRFGDEAVKFADHRVSSVWVDVPRAKRVSNLSKPDLASNHLWVDSIVRDDVHVIPPTIEKVVVELIVHSHVEHVHRWQVAGSGGADHLAVVDDAKVRCTHGVQVLVVLTIHKDYLTVPITLPHELLNVLLASRARMCADHSHEVIERTSLG